MKITLLTQYLENYAALAAITGEERRAYVERWVRRGHNYVNHAMVGEYHGELPFGFQRIKLIRDLLDGADAPDAIFWMGCDTIILNHEKPIELFLGQPYADRYDFFITADVHGINSDSFIIRNTPWARKWLDFILHKLGTAAAHCWAEQRVIQLYWQDEKFVSKIMLLPQGMINSYDYALYPPWDPATTAGQVQKGDFLLHLPGLVEKQRIEIFTSQRVRDLMIK
jgi:hypothetical protein